MKRQVGKLNATPSKRLFLSIIADYDLNRSVCELIDNGLDVWVRGGRSSKIKIYEGVVAAELIAKQDLEQRNRIALIVLDSTLEIGFKEFLVNDSGTYYSDAKLLSIFQTRHAVHTEVKQYVNLPAATWQKISHYSNLRNKFIHQRATAGVSDDELADFRELTEAVLKKLYKLKFKVN